MRPGLRLRPTYANVTATLALFVALGGGAYAASSIPSNSVGGKQLRKNSVVAAKIKKNAVSGPKVLDNSLTGADINESSLAKVASAALADHAAAAAALDKVTYKTAAGSAAASSAANAATATCDSGQHVIGGGVKLDPPGIGVVHLNALPDGVSLDGSGEVARYLRAFARLRLAALTPAASARLLREMARD